MITALSYRQACGFIRVDWRSPIVAIMIIAALDVAWIVGAHISLSGWPALSATLILAAGFCTLANSPLRHSPLTEYVGYLFAWTLFTLSICMLTYLTARLSLPLMDDTFAELDAALGFNWVAWSRFVFHDISFFMYAQYAYNGLLPITLLSTLLFALRAPGRNAELLWAAIIAASMTICLFTAFPAMGASVHFGLDQVHYPYIDALRHLRAGDPNIDLGNMTGIVSFPSYHGALAVMFAYSHRGLRTFYPIAILCTLMWLSSMTMGNHYLIDLVAGTVIAVLAIVLAKKVSPAQTIR